MKTGWNLFIGFLLYSEIYFKLRFIEVKYFYRSQF